ncbi:PAXNEB protein-domain-containing protein [Hyaloraphidium curvatum]|nr:PAXNEB protein-domain-containing protein [Hyaloraphidium curvatum]
MLLWRQLRKPFLARFVGPCRSPSTGNGGLELAMKMEARTIRPATDRLEHRTRMARTRTTSGSRGVTNPWHGSRPRQWPTVPERSHPAPRQCPLERLPRNHHPRDRLPSSTLQRRGAMPWNPTRTISSTASGSIAAPWMRIQRSFPVRGPPLCATSRVHWNASETHPHRVIRVCLPDLGAPSSRLRLRSPTDFTMAVRFLVSLKHNIRRSSAVCVVTMDTHAFGGVHGRGDNSSVQRLARCCDAVFELESFAGSVMGSKSPYAEEFHGLFLVERMFRNELLAHTSRISEAGLASLGFKARRKAFSILSVHLPPESAGTGAALEHSKDT